MPQAPSMKSSGRHMRHGIMKSARNKWIALLSVCMLVVLMGFGGAILLRLRANLHTEPLNISDFTGAVENGALDILIIGSDTRKGNNGAYGNDDDRNSEARSDVMMLLQISADRKNINVLSFPRDLVVSIPKCTDPKTNKAYEAEDDIQINESLARGGPGCTAATISKLTGVHIDHFMLVDFNAVKELSRVVGGVEVCVDNPVNDEYSGLNLPAGNSKVEGEQALAFLRSRHGFGDGSDIGRIQAQQGFLSALLRKVKAEGTLDNPNKLLNIAEAITQNVTVDDDLGNPNEIAGIGATIGGIDLSEVVFATIPTEPWNQDPNRLQLTSEAQSVFQRLRDDKSLKVEEAKQGDSAPAQLDKSIPITVYNATGIDGRAAALARIIGNLGYTSVTPASTAESVSTTTISYGEGYEAEAREIAAKMNITRVEPNAQVTGVTLTIGTDFPSGDAMEKQDSQIAGGAAGQTADQATCQHAFAY